MKKYYAVLSMRVSCGAPKLEVCTTSSLERAKRLQAEFLVYLNKLGLDGTVWVLPIERLFIRISSLIPMIERKSGSGFDFSLFDVKASVDELNEIIAELTRFPFEIDDQIFE